MENNIVPITPEVNVVPQKTNPSIVKILILIIFLLVIIFVGVIAYLSGSNKTEVPAPTPTPVAIPTPAPTIEATTAPVSSSSAAPTIKPVITPIPTPTPKVNANPNLKTFTSDALKISFDYLQVQPDYPKEKTSVSVSGNKVYIYMGTKPEEGQWVEVFQKDKNDTLAQAIKKQFLQGIADKDCFVVDSNAQNKFPANYKLAEISFPYDPNSDIPMFATENKCPQTYTQSNGISFFLADTNHPDIFLFFSIGQYGINADGGKMWQETIKFL